MIKRRIKTVVVLSGLALAVVSIVNPARAAVPAGTIEVIDEASDTISIERGKGRLLRLPRSVATVFLADPDVADVQVKSLRMVYLLAKKVGETSLFGAGRGDDLVTSLKVRVVHDLAWLNSMVRETAPGETIRVQSIEGAIILSGSVATTALAADLQALAERFAGKDSVINRLTISGSTQVNLRVRMAEVSRSVIERLGINWDALFDNGTALFGLATGNPAVAAGSFLTRTDGADNVVAGLRTNSVDLNVVIDFLANEGLVTILAEPNLTALNGQKAEFLAGGEFPIVVPQNDGLFTIIFKEFGVSLEFIPTVLSGGRISLHVAPEVSQLSSRGETELVIIVTP